MSEEPEKILNFLLNIGSNILPKSYKKLKSYFNIHASQVAEKCNLTLPKYFNKKNISCPYCFTSWKSAESSFKLLPSTGKKFKINNSEGSENIHCTRNKLVLKCNICLRKSVFSLIKPSKFREKDQNKNESNCKLSGTRKKKKKKCANLNVKACLDAGYKTRRQKQKCKTKLMQPPKIQKNNVPLSEQSCKVSKTKSLFKNPYAVNNSNFSKSNEKEKIHLKNKNMKVFEQNKEFEKNVKKAKQLRALKKAIKEEKSQQKSTKSSLQDFLNVLG